MSKKVKIFAVVALVLALIIGASAYFGGTASDSGADSPLSSSAQKAAGVPISATAAPSEFSVLLSTIRSISIDTTIFQDNAYRALRDYPITLGVDTKGRPNPFAPVGYDSGTITGSAPAPQTSFETIQPGKITSTTAEFGAQGLVSNPEEAMVVFEYGLNDLLGSATAPIPLGKNGSAFSRVTGLVPATVYYVRAVLVQGSTTTPGNIMTFTTSPAR